MNLQDWIEQGKPMNSFVNCDCMLAVVEIEDNYFDLAIVDPPYGLERFKNGIGKNDRHKVKTKNLDWNNNKPDQIYFNELFRISKNQIIWGANNFILPESEYFIIWDKKQTVDNFASAEYAYTNIKKPAQIFRYGIHQHNKTKKIHPTQKPIDLYRWLLKHYAKPEDKIIDTHVGSGSSLIACHDEGFEYLGFELDQDYYNDASKRIDQHKAQGKLF